MLFGNHTLLGIKLRPPVCKACTESVELYPALVLTFVPDMKERCMFLSHLASQFSLVEETFLPLLDFTLQAGCDLQFMRRRSNSRVCH